MLPHYVSLNASVLRSFSWNTAGREAVQITHHTFSPAFLPPHAFELLLPHHDITASLTLGYYRAQMSVNQPRKLSEPRSAAHANNQIQVISMEGSTWKEVQEVHQ